MASARLRQVFASLGETHCFRTAITFLRKTKKIGTSARRILSRRRLLRGVLFLVAFLSRIMNPPSIVCMTSSVRLRFTNIEVDSGYQYIIVFQSTSTFSLRFQSLIIHWMVSICAWRFGSLVSNLRLDRDCGRIAVFPAHNRKPNKGSNMIV